MIKIGQITVSTVNIDTLKEELNIPETTNIITSDGDDANKIPTSGAVYDALNELTFDLNYNKNEKTITLNKNNDIVSSIDISDMLIDGMVENVALEDNILKLSFNVNDETGEPKVIEVDLSNLIPIYTEGTGIKFVSNSINVADNVALTDKENQFTAKQTFDDIDATTLNNLTIPTTGTKLATIEDISVADKTSIDSIGIDTKKIAKSITLNDTTYELASKGGEGIYAELTPVEINTDVVEVTSSTEINVTLPYDYNNVKAIYLKLKTGDNEPVSLVLTDLPNSINDFVWIYPNGESVTPPAMFRLFGANPTNTRDEFVRARTITFKGFMFIPNNTIQFIEMFVIDKNNDININYDKYYFKINEYNELTLNHPTVRITSDSNFNNVKTIPNLCVLYVGEETASTIPNHWYYTATGGRYEWDDITPVAKVNVDNKTIVLEDDKLTAKGVITAYDKLYCVGTAKTIQYNGEFYKSVPRSTPKFKAYTSKTTTISSGSKRITVPSGDFEGTWLYLKSDTLPCYRITEGSKYPTYTYIPIDYNIGESGIKFSAGSGTYSLVTITEDIPLPTETYDLSVDIYVNTITNKCIAIFQGSGSGMQYVLFKEIYRTVTNEVVGYVPHFYFAKENLKTLIVYSNVNAELFNSIIIDTISEDTTVYPKSECTIYAGISDYVYNKWSPLIKSYIGEKEIKINDNVISVDLSAYATTDYVDDSFDTVNSALEKVINGETPISQTYTAGEGISINDNSISVDNTILRKNELPSNVSAFTNDIGYLTEHQDLSDYASKSEIPSLTGYATEEYVNNAIANAGGSGNNGNYLKLIDNLDDYEGSEGEIVKYSGASNDKYIQGADYKYTLSDKNITISSDDNYANRLVITNCTDSNFDNSHLITPYYDSLSIPNENLPAEPFMAGYYGSYSIYCLGNPELNKEVILVSIDDVKYGTITDINGNTKTITFEDTNIVIDTSFTQLPLTLGVIEEMAKVVYLHPSGFAYSTNAFLFYDSDKLKMLMYKQYDENRIKTPYNITGVKVKRIELTDFCKRALNIE